MVAFLHRGQLRRFFRRGGNRAKGQNRSNRSPGFRGKQGRRISIDVPEHLRDGWGIWQVATSKHFRDTFVDIETLWSFDDLLDSHDVIEMLDELERRRTAPQK